MGKEHQLFPGVANWPGARLSCGLDITRLLREAQTKPVSNKPGGKGPEEDDSLG